MITKPLDAVADIRSARHRQGWSGRAARNLKRQPGQHAPIPCRIADEVGRDAIGDGVATMRMCGAAAPDERMKPEQKRQHMQ